jgi:hypothetical protein
MATAFVKSHQAFRRWLKNEAPAHSTWYAAIAFETTLVLSTEPEWFYEFNVTETKTEKRRFALHPIDLPSLQPADASKTWWDSRFDAQIMLCLRHRSGEYVCVARLGTWEALPGWCSNSQRDDWEEIEYEAWLALIQSRVAAEMQHEFQLLGISVRPVPPHLWARRS